MEFCPHGTRVECLRSQQDTEELQANKKIDEVNNVTIKVTADEPATAEKEEPLVAVIITNETTQCNKLHFKKIIQLHTDESLGDCSFLNTCFHMDSCK